MQSLLTVAAVTGIVLVTLAAILAFAILLGKLLKKLGE
jgi:hypothetical protein